ncbi:hypothetical protein DAI22_04g090900 [Oryza sativa Japonica Group]|nr:hypothetical protein DAI22_04g090900 [Oryza sativa Japonica Group]
MDRLPKEESLWNDADMKHELNSKWFRFSRRLVSPCPLRLCLGAQVIINSPCRSVHQDSTVL